MTNDSEIQGLASLKRPELQRMCKKWGLKASGKNSELMERLEEALRSGHAAPANEESGDTDENELNERIETLDSQGQGQSLVQVESERAEEQREANGPFAEISGKIETLTINDSVGNETVVAQIATAAETDVFERTRPLLSNSRRSSVSSKATNASNSTKSSSLPRSKLRRPTYLKHIHSRVDSGLKKVRGETTKNSTRAIAHTKT